MQKQKVVSLFALGALLLLAGAGCGENPTQNTPAQQEEVQNPNIQYPASDSEETASPTPPPTSQTPSPNPSPTPTAEKPAATSYTMAQVAANNTPSKCWTAINDIVYDLTTWIAKHPGGPEKIELLCGIDGSSKFNGKHGGQMRPEQMLATFKIGVLKK